MDALLENRKARMQYAIIETMEAGVVLTGAEVKSLRLKRGSLNEGFVKVLNGQAQLINVLIQQYDFTPGKTYDPTRTRPLLLHKKEIEKLDEYLHVKGLTAMPLMIGIKHRYIKVLIGIGKGKKQHERREELKRRDIEREVKRLIK
ncbi:SsrA-binding protein [Candidatus Cerribacteria bacterium 'Amazon FNV 2010 28 9']|uniref:SsrA-binding protein n=1 Tax=Candidatus Cerribacteria bacterium 'Amazon FNV 2010 28 9' TaxID=2081795 RepID=A0A317JQ44_9BACT|nr:MAG: SsrA-binding protein [Candidatus Cerribacteria bacterium 'Amazon FNV 2010 28 9']